MPEGRCVFPNLTVSENPEVPLLYVLENGAVRDEGPMPEFLASRGERVAHGNLLFLSGVGPGQSTPGLNLLVRRGPRWEALDRVKGLVKVPGMVNSAPGFTDQPKVID